MRELTLTSANPRPPLLLPSGRSTTTASVVSCLFRPASRRQPKGSSLSSSTNASSRIRPLLAQRKPLDNNTDEVIDDELLDDLLKKHGTVVYKSQDLKPPAEEADEDAESLSFAVALAKIANDVKGADIRVLFVRPLVFWTRAFVIVTAFSLPQIDAIGSKMRDAAELQFNRISNGDVKPNPWTLLDFDDVVVHIFLPPQRAFYNLDEFYGNAVSIELPFKNETPPFHTYNALE